jgi:hypothetical protein
MFSVYQLVLRSQALGQTVRRPRPSEQRRALAAREASELRVSRLNELIREARRFRKPWR